MGITNFHTYIEKALKWPPPRQRYTVTRLEELRYFNRIYRSACETLGTPERHIFPELDVKAETEEVLHGIAVDLSSFCYPTIVNEITSSIHGIQTREDRASNPETIRRLGVDRESTSRISVGTSSRRAVADMFVADPPGCANIGNPVSDECARPKSTRNLIRLDELTVEACARRCYESILSVVGRARIENADYVSLNFDDNTTSCKWYQQEKRRENRQFVIDNVTKRRMFLKVIELAMVYLKVDTTNRTIHELTRAVETSYGDSGDADTATKLLELLRCDRFITNTVAHKMCLSPDEFGIRERYLSGEGEWMCFYAINDLECDATTESTDAFRQRWYVYGNDSDIGLGVLLFSSQRTSICYANAYSCLMSSPDSRGKTSDELRSHKAVHFFSLSLLGNDYVLRMVNESDANISSLGKEVDRILSSEEEHCRRYVGVLGESFLDVALERTEDCDSPRVPETSDFSRALAYVLVRLLLAVYGDKDGRNRHGVVEESSKCIRNATDPQPRPYVDRTRLRCKSNEHKSFTECFSSFAVRCLWYMAYCLFYRNMDRRRRQTFRNKRLSDNDCQLYVSGLPMRTVFTYNDSRLYQPMQLELSNTIDVRHAVANMTTEQLLVLMEIEISKILTE